MIRFQGIENVTYQVFLRIIFWVDFKYAFYNLLVKKVNLLEWVVTLDVRWLTPFLHCVLHGKEITIMQQEELIPTIIKAQ